MLLKDLLYKAPLISYEGESLDIEIHKIEFDSRKVTSGDLFVAIKGYQVDGHQYIAKAVEQGAIAIICEELPAELMEGLTYVKVRDSSIALGEIAANFFNRPSERMRVVAVTGTNGKTTVATLLFKLFSSMGYNCGLLSTVKNQILEEEIIATHTTGDPIQIQSLMAKMIKKGVSHCFMEASSHAIHQNRIAGIKLTGAIFTNISHDHLDYHKTFDNYIKAKKALFDQLPSSAFALSNLDDKRGEVMLQNTKAKKYYYSLEGRGSIPSKLLANGFHGLQLSIDQKEVWFQLVGKFNAYNLLAVYQTGLYLGEDSDELLQQLSEIRGAAGRFEKFFSKDGVTVIVDYAHTPDALENVLQTISDLRTGNETLYTIVGCGGNRDAEKRPVMGDIATRFSNTVVFTSDNPRDEEPEAIVEAMVKGVSPSNYRKVKRIIDRKEALEFCISEAKPSDIILVAGKGHEDYQEIKGVKYPFDDRKLVEMLLGKR